MMGLCLKLLPPQGSLSPFKPLFCQCPLPSPAFLSRGGFSVKGHEDMLYAVLRIPFSAQHTAKVAPKLSSPSTELVIEHQLTYSLIFNLLCLTCIILFSLYNNPIARPLE